MQFTAAVVQTRNHSDEQILIRLHSSLTRHLHSALLLPHSTLYRAVVPDATDSEAAASAQQDWALDAHTLPPAVACEGMPLANFYRALFGIADVWTVGCSEREYVTFLTILLQRVLTLGFGAPQADADCSVPVSPNGLVTVSVPGFQHPDLIRALWIAPGGESAAASSAAAAAAAAAAATAGAATTAAAAAAAGATAGADDTAVENGSSGHTDDGDSSAAAEESLTDGASHVALQLQASVCDSAAESMPSLCLEDVSVLEHDGDSSSDAVARYITAGTTAAAGAGVQYSIDGSSSKQQQKKQQQVDGSMVTLGEFTAQHFAMQPAVGAAFMLFW
jgi:hypothetical protein